MPALLAAAVALVWTSSRRGFLSAAVLQIIGALSALGVVVVGKIALDAMVDAGSPDGPSVGTLLPAIVMLALVTALSTASTTLQTQQQRLLGEHVSQTVWRRLLDVTGRVRLESFESPRFFDQLQRVQNNAASRPLTVATSLLGLIGGAVGIVGLVIAVASIEPLLVPFLVLAGLPALLLSRRASRSEYMFSLTESPRFRMRHYLREALTGREAAKEIRAFRAQEALGARERDLSEGYLVALTRQVRLRQRYATVSIVLSSLVLGGTLGLLAYFLTEGRVDLGEAGAAAIAIRLLAGRLDLLFSSIGALFESGLFLADLDDFLGLAASAGAATEHEPAAHDSEVVLDDVSFAYPESPDKALDGVSLRIGRGEIVALVGENGSGKTTLAKILAGLYRPTGGRVLWDGRDVTDQDAREVARPVAVIFQDFVRYQLTARENIGLGDPDHMGDLDAAQAAARQARADGFLSRLPLGYDTVLSKQYEDGQDLSVGQWQRVALARAFRRNAPVVILDEPSAALDPRAEQALFEDIRSLVDNRSVLLISHRYSSVRNADRIYVLQDGHIVESGAHDELMRRAGLYSELFSLQARAYQ